MKKYLTPKNAFIAVGAVAAVLIMFYMGVDAPADNATINR